MSVQPGLLERLPAILASLDPVGAGAARGPLVPETPLTLDSLARVELAVLLEEQLGIEVDEAELAGAETVGQLLGLAGRGDAAPPASHFPQWALSLPARAARDVLQSTLLFPLHAWACRPFSVEGRERLDAPSPPVLLIANHCSHLDAAAVLRALPPAVRRRTAVAAADDYFFQDRRLAFAVSLLLNAFPFSRETAVRASLDYCGRLADAGWSILIFPEGTRSSTGRLQPFRSGIGLMAHALAMPVVPIGLEGTHRVLPKGTRQPRPGPVVVRFGESLSAPSGCPHPQAAALLQSRVAALLRPEQAATLEPLPESTHNG